MGAKLDDDYWYVPGQRFVLFNGVGVGKTIEAEDDGECYFAESGVLVPLWAAYLIVSTLGDMTKTKLDDNVTVYTSTMQPVTETYLIEEQLIVLEASNSTQKEIDDALDYLNSICYFNIEKA